MKSDGCSSIATSNWKKLKAVIVCWPTDKTDPVTTLSLVAANWPSKAKVESATYTLTSNKKSAMFWRPASATQNDLSQKNMIPINQPSARGYF